MVGWWRICARQAVWQALCLLLMLAAVLPGAVRAQADFLDPDLAFVPGVAMADPLALDVHFTIAPGYYMYQERFEVQVRDAHDVLLLFRRSALTPPDAVPETPRWQAPLQLPRGQVKYDPTFERDMEVYHQGVTLRVPLQAGAAAPLQVVVTGQGCADAGLCYPPMSKSFTLAATADGYRAQGPLVREQVPAPRDEVPLQAASGGSGRASGAPLAGPVVQGGWLELGDTGMAAWLHQAPLWQILLLSAAFGVLLSLTPCVLPMVPILLALIARRDGRAVGRLRGLGLAAVYVLGMSVVYTVLGVLAGLLGAGLAAWLQSPWVLGSFALLLALFGLAMLDVFTLQAPVGLQSALQSGLARLPGGQVGGVFLMGMVSALIVGPCVAAPLAGVLLFISQTGDVVVGGSALFAMAWGEGLLLLVVGAGAGALLPRAGAWMNLLKAGFGLLLLATAWWMARPLLGATLYVAGWVLLAVWAALLLWAGGGPAGHAGGLQGAAAGTAQAGVRPLPLLLRTLALLLALWGLSQGAGLLAGGTDMLRPLAPFMGGSAWGGSAADPAAIRARFTVVRSVQDLDARLANADRPILLDFYADWCVSCLEMEKFTFSDPQVAARMNRMLLLQADVTRMSADDRALLDRYQLFGPPGILFFDRHGQLLADARVVGFRKADAFGRLLDQVLLAGN